MRQGMLPPGELQVSRAASVEKGNVTNHNFRRCVNSNLVQQNTPVNGSYSLAVINSGIAQLNGVAISACGQSFIVSGASCTYCPDLAITSGLCMKFSNKTIFSGSLFLVSTQ